MTLAKDIVTEAIRELGILDSTEEPSSEDTRDTLRILNRMMNGWAAQGVDIGHVDMGPNDEFMLNTEYEHAAVMMLAKEAAGIFNEPVTASLLQAHADSWGVIQAGYIEAPRTEFDRTLLRLPSQRLFGIATTT